MGSLRDRLEAGIVAAVSDVRVNGSQAPRLPNLASVSFAGADPEALLARLDLEGVSVSAGSACASGALEQSHVIAALGNEGPAEGRRDPLFTWGADHRSRNRARFGDPARGRRGGQAFGADSCVRLARERGYMNHGPNGQRLGQLPPGALDRSESA